MFKHMTAWQWAALAFFVACKMSGLVTGGLIAAAIAMDGFNNMALGSLIATGVLWVCTMGSIVMHLVTREPGSMP